MKKTSKRRPLQQWASQITALRQRLKINQAELARRMECSAMTISRWERGLLQPSAEHFVQLGNLGSKNEAWFFWEMAGIQASKMLEALSTTSHHGFWSDVRQLEQASAGAKALHPQKKTQLVGLPLLKAVIGTHGVPSHLRTSLRAIPATEILGAPAPWCPNPAYTSLLRVKGHSMEPLIRDGDILAIDSFQTDRNELYGKVVIAVSEHKGICVSHLRRYDGLDVLEGENRQHDPVILNKASGWRIMGRVLWWISTAP
ncbi:MAG TPA: XRE family transcriptional regulator [Candidatus Sulfotelmatobacter sp.]|nr:XRE family transcriptional regulator [Candidatus Sulfotelmatobacter sp.]